MKSRKTEKKGKLSSQNTFVQKRKNGNTRRVSKVKLSQKKGQFTSGKVTLSETAVNNKILRIRLTRLDLYGQKKKVKSFGRRKIKSVPAEAKTKATNLSKRAALVAQNTNSVSQHIFKKQIRVKLSPQNYSPKRKMVVNNGKVTKTDPDDYFVKRLKSNQNGKIFYLKAGPYKSAAEGKLDYKFHQLVNDVKNMQLPTPSWKIKVIIRHNKIAAIIFTNKAELERSLSFNSDDDKYHLVIDNKPALLLGSPGKVNNCNEIEVLLSIMETIEKDSPMIVYK